MVSKLLQIREISSGRREFQQIYSSFHDKIDVAVQSGVETLIELSYHVLLNSVYQAGLADHPEFVIVITRLLLNCIRILPAVLFSSHNKSFSKLFSVQSQYRPQVDPIYYQMTDEL